MIFSAVKPTMSYFSLPGGERTIAGGSLTGKKRIWPMRPARASNHEDVLWPESAHTYVGPLALMSSSGTPIELIQSIRWLVPADGHESPAASSHVFRLMKPQLLELLNPLAPLSYQ